MENNNLHAIPLKPDIPSSGSDSTGSRGWISGWTFTAPVPELFRPTACALSLSLCHDAGTLLIEIPGQRLEWSLPIAGTPLVRITPHGLRLIDQGDESDTVCSLAVIDASTVVVEAEYHVLEKMLESPPDPSLKQIECTSSKENQHLVTIIDRTKTPARMVMMSGTGALSGLLTIARGHLAKSAHLLLDHELTRHDHDIASFANMSRDAHDLIVSRLRPASPELPFPWIADEENEPVWRLDQLLPIHRYLTHVHPTIAEGLIGNLLELMNEHGQFPLAGGNASPLFYGDTEFPALFQIILYQFEQTGKWPADMEFEHERFQRYFSHTVHGSAEHLAPVFAILLEAELRAWKNIVNHTGPVNDYVQQRWACLPARSPEINDKIQSPLLKLMDHRTPSSQRHLMAREIDDTLRKSNHDLTAPYGPALTLLALKEVSSFSASHLKNWIDHIQTNYCEIFGNGASGISTHPALAVISHSFSGWMLGQQKDAVNVNDQSVFVRINRHRMKIGVIMTLVAVGLAAFYTSVLFRSSMPIAMFKTQLGMALKDYQSGHFEEALELVKDIERQGHSRTPVVLTMLGKIYYKQGDFDLAVDYFSKAHKNNPEDPAILFNLALSQFRKGNTQEAQETFDYIATVFGRSHPSTAAQALRAMTLVKDYELANPEKSAD